MANAYYNFTGGPFIPGTKARSDQVNTEYQAIVSAFDYLPLEADAITGGRSTFAGVTAGSGNAYTVAMPNTRASNNDGDEIVFIADRTNTGAATLNVDGIGAVNIVKVDGTAVAAGDLEIDLIYAVRYDATNLRFQMMLQTVDAAAQAAAAAASATASAASALEAYHWAQYPEDSLVPEGDLATEYSAYHWSKKAEGWAASVNHPNIAGNALKFVRVNAGETSLEYYDLFGSVNYWRNDNYIYPTWSGNASITFKPLDAGADGAYHGIWMTDHLDNNRALLGSLPGDTASYAMIAVWDDTLGTPAWNQALSIARDALPVTLTSTGLKVNGASPYIYANADASTDPTFLMQEGSTNKASWWYDHTAHTMTIQKQLDATPGTAAGKIELKDSGEILMTDAVGGVTLSLTGAVVEAGSTGATSLRVNAATNNSPTAYLKENGNSRSVWFYDYASHIAYLRKYLDATPASITNQVKLGDDGSLTLEDVTDSTSLVVNSDGTTVYGTGTANCRLSVDAPTNQYATFNLRENGNNRGQLYYDYSAHDFNIRKFLDATPATVAGLIQLADSGTITIKDNINNTPVVISGAANGGTMTFNGKGTRVRACVVNCANPTPSVVLNPASWTISRISTGRYRVTHDYNSYNVVITGNALGGGLDCVLSFQMISASTFDIFMYVAGSLADNAYLNLLCVLF